MSDRAKLIIRILAFVLAVVILGWAIWAVFFRTPGTSVIPGRPVPGAPGQLPVNVAGGERRIVEPGPPSLLVPEPAASQAAVDTVAAGGRTRVESLSAERADFMSVNASGGFNYYNSDDGKFYRLSAQGGERVAITDEAFRGADNVTWSDNGERVVLEFPDGANIFYDLNTKERATLPRAARTFDFSPTGSQVAYQYIGPGVDDRWIVVSEANGQGQTLVQPLGNEAQNVQVAWSPNNEVIATFRQSTSPLGEEVFFIGFNNENFLSLQTNGLGFQGKWSPRGEQMLYSVYSQNTDYKPALHISLARGENIGAGNRSLRLNTWPEKCAFAGETELYCAVPQSLELGSGLYPELAANTSDTIYKIDLTTNISTPVASLEAEDFSSFSVNNLTVAPAGDALYFTDAVSGKIRRLRLR